MIKLAIGVAIIIFFFLLTRDQGIAIEFSHPPTYEQYMATYKKGKKAYNALTEALKFTDDELQILEAQNRIDFVIGAAYQMPQEVCVRFLSTKIADLRSIPEGLSLYLNQALQQEVLFNSVALEAELLHFRTIAPDNAYPFYLLAYYYCRKGNRAACLKHIEGGNEAANFENYNLPLANILIETSVFLGYSRIVAQLNALGQHNDVMIFRNLSKFIIGKAAPLNEAEIVWAFGEKLRANSKTLLLTAFSLSIQSKALAQLSKFADMSARRRRLNEQNREYHALSATLSKISKEYNLSASRWKQYYTILYGSSEKQAIEKLSKEYPLE